MRRFLTLFGLGLLAATHASAGSIKTFTNETLTAGDLNSNFSHIHTQAERSLANADISSSAAIAHSKLATPTLLPKAVTKVGSGSTACSAGTCTVPINSGKISAVSFSATGIYNVAFTANPLNAEFSVQVTSHTDGIYCTATNFATANPHFVVRCRTDANVATNAVFSIVVFDDA